MGRKHKLFVNPIAQAEYDRQGYTIIPLMTPEVAANLCTAFKASFAEIASQNEENSALYFSNRDENTHLSEKGAFFAKDAIGARILQQLVDYALILGNSAIKFSGGAAIPTHVHSPITLNPYSPTLFIWFAINDCAAENGALQFVPNSHRIVPHVHNGNTKPYYHSFQKEIESRYMQTIILRAGEAIFFHNDIIHRSLPNDSGQDRYSLILAACPKTEIPAIYAWENDQHMVDILSWPENFHEYDDGYWNKPAPKEARILKTIPNPNIQITLDEFDQLLAHKNKLSVNYNPLDHITRTEVSTPMPLTSFSLTKHILRKGKSILRQWIRSA